MPTAHPNPTEAQAWAAVQTAFAEYLETGSLVKKLELLRARKTWRGMLIRVSP